MEIKNLEQTCSACPSQWEFRTDQDRPVYVRYRWGYLSVCVGLPDKGLGTAVNGIEVYGADIGGGWDGFIEWREVEKRIKSLDITAIMEEEAETENKS